MPWYIKSEKDGLFVGECLGFGFFQSNITEGECSPEEEPIEFESQKEAQGFLDSWSGGPSDCKVVFLGRGEVVQEHTRICTEVYNREVQN